MTDTPQGFRSCANAAAAPRTASLLSLYPYCTLRLHSQQHSLLCSGALAAAMHQPENIHHRLWTAASCPAEAGSGTRVNSEWQMKSRWQSNR